MRVFYAVLVTVLMAVSGQVRAADFFQAIAEYRDDILYLLRVSVDFLAGDTAHVQLKMHNDGRWHVAAGNITFVLVATNCVTPKFIQIPD